MKKIVYTMDITSDMLNLDNTEPMSADKLIMERVEQWIHHELTKPDPIDVLIATGKLTLHEVQIIRELQKENERLKDEINSLEWEIAEIHMGEDF